MVLFPHLSGSCSVILKGSGFLVLLLYCRTWCLFVYRAITCSMSLLFAFSVNWKCQTVLLLRRRYWHAAVRWCLGVRRLDNGYLRLFELLIWTICYYMHYAIWSWSWSSHRYVMLMGACITTISWRTVKWASKNNISVGKLVACLKVGFNVWKMFLLGTTFVEKWYALGNIRSKGRHLETELRRQSLHWCNWKTIGDPMCIFFYF